MDTELGPVSNISTGAYDITLDSDLVYSFLGFGPHRTGLVFGSLEEPIWTRAQDAVTLADNEVLHPALLMISSSNPTQC